jgi:hypothetical protein
MKQERILAEGERPLSDLLGLDARATESITILSKDGSASSHGSHDDHDDHE